MQYTRLAIAVTALLALPALAPGGTWEIDSAHTTVQFSVRHMMVSNVRGDFGDVTGTVQGDEATPRQAAIDATVKTASIDTRNAKRDDHLRSPDFFDVAKFPTMTFKSKRIEPATGDGRWKVTGDLTLHGVTREVVLDVEGPTAPVKDPMGNIRAGAHATTRINRKDFGMTWSKALEAGGLIVGDDVDITIDVEATKKGGA